MTKTCTKCRKNKPAKDFIKKCGVSAQPCLECQRIYSRQHYRDNKNYYIEKAREQADRISKQLRDYKSSLSCSICGENHPACIEFHHRNPEEKDFDISESRNHGWSWGRVLKEIKKCDVLCSNCHRKYHYVEGTGPWGSYK